MSHICSCLTLRDCFCVITNSVLSHLNDTSILRNPQAGRPGLGENKSIRDLPDHYLYKFVLIWLDERYI